MKIEETSRPRAKVTELLEKEDDTGGVVGRGVGLLVVVSSSGGVAIVVVGGGGTVVVEVASSNTVVVVEGGGTVAPVLLAVVATESISPLCEFDVAVVVVAAAVKATHPTLVPASPSSQHDPDPNPAQ